MLHGYCGLDWGSDVESRRSTTCFVFKFAGASIALNSRRQPTIILSSTDAELMAAYEATTEAVWLKLLLSNLGYESQLPIAIYEDNQSCIKLNKIVEAHQRTKHMDIRYPYVREQVNNNFIILVPCPSKLMVADVLTKSVTGQRTLNMYDELGLRRLTLSEVLDNNVIFIIFL